MPRFSLPVSSLLAAAMLTGGCASGGGFPSLAQRPAELIDYETEPVRTAPVVAPEAGLDARIAELLAEARRGDAAFGAAAGAAEAGVGGAGAAGSESWIVAQQAISRLEAARAASVTALAELDRMSIARAQQPSNVAQFQTLVAAVETVSAIVGAQQARLDRLRGRLSAL